MATKTEICNEAMALLGQGRLTDVDTDTSERAKWGREVFDNSRDRALREHTWNCSIARKVLGSNLLLQSEAFSNASWTKTNASATADQLRSPDGNTTADLLDDADGVNAGTVAQAVTVADNSDPYTFSVYVKEGTAAVTRLTIALTGGTGVTLNIDITWSTTPSVSAGSITDIGEGWWRVSGTATNNASGNTTLTCTIYPAGATGSATGTVYAWGAQLIRGSAVTGYVSTTTAAVQPLFPPFGYKYAHALPSDFIRVDEVGEGDRRYRIESGYLHTDDAAVELRYVKQLTDPADFDILFARGLAVQLAKDLCVALTGSRELMDDLEAAWREATALGRTADSQEDGQDAELIDPWIAARWS